MVGLDYVINLLDKNFTGGMKSALATTKGLDDAVGKTAKRTKSLEAASSQGFGGMITWAKRAAVTMGLVFGLQQAMAFGNEITNVTAKMEGYENAIKFASGEDGAKNLQFLDKTIKDLNLDMSSSYKGFQTLSGSLRGTKLEGQATRDIFEAVGVAGTVMGLSAEQSEGAFLALSQMASKGKVQAEELRGQLGERIPGALKIAADAMGVNQVEFNKMLDSGQVYADDFLPKFAAELKKTFQEGLPAAADSMQAAINKKNNALLSFKKTFGEATEPISKYVLGLKTDFFNTVSGLDFAPILESIGKLVQAVSPITDRFKEWFSEIGGGQGILNASKTALDNMAVYLEIAANGIVFLWDALKPFIPTLFIAAIAMWAMSAPVTAIIVGIGLLAGALMYAYDKVGWFRGSIKAVVTYVKEFATVIKTYVIERIKSMIAGITGIGKTLMLFFKGEWKEAWKAGKQATNDLLGFDAAKNAVSGLKEAGKKAGESYNQGVAEADANSNKKFTLFDTKKPTANESVFGDTIIEPNGVKPGGDKPDDKKPTASVSGGGSGSGKNVTFQIDSLVKQITIQPQNLKEGLQDVEKQVKDIFIRLIRDVELQTN